MARAFEEVQDKSFEGKDESEFDVELIPLGGVPPDDAISGDDEEEEEEDHFSAADIVADLVPVYGGRYSPAREQDDIHEVNNLNCV